MKPARRYSVLFLALWAYSASFAKYNILLLIADDCTRFDLGAYGSKDSKTPVIDNLASQGMRFTKCYQAAPICSPTRHNLYTGMYPTRTGAYPNHTFAATGTLSVVQRLRPLGYRVGIAGKRHIGPDSVFPFENIDTDTGDGDGPGPDFAKVDAFLADAVAKKDKFCVILASHQPHSPWNRGDPSQFNANTITLPPNFVDNAATRTNFQNYLAEINYLDGQLKSALDLLDKHGLTDSTVVFFTSEQGTSMPFAKWTCYNAGLGSAMIVRWPGVVAPGTVSDALIEYSDVLPTFIDIAGGAAASGLDGSTFVPVLRGQTNRHKDYSHGIQTTHGINQGSEYFPIRSINDGKYRLIVNYAPDVTFFNASEMPGWAQDGPALTDKFRHRPAIELYDDGADKWNLANLATDARYDSVQTRLEGKLSEWMRYAGDDPLQTELSAFDHMDRPAFNGDTVIVVQTQSPANNLKNTAAGVHYALYNGTWTALPDFSTLTPARTGTVPNFTGTASLPGKTGNRYAVQYSGYVDAPVKAYHTFYLNSFNHARLSIDGHFIVGTTLNQGNLPARRYGSILLDTGRHAIEVSFLGNSVKDSLSVTWSYPGLIEAVGNLLVPNNALVTGELVVTGLQTGSSNPAWLWKVQGNALAFSPELRHAEVRLFDARGSVLRHTWNPSRMDLSSLPRGLYVLEIRSENVRIARGVIPRM